MPSDSPRSPEGLLTGCSIDGHGRDALRTLSTGIDSQSTLRPEMDQLRQTSPCCCSSCSYGIKQTYVSDTLFTPDKLQLKKRIMVKGHVHAGSIFTGL